MKGMAITLLVVLAMVQLMAKPEARKKTAVTCGQVDAALAPCISYLTSGGTPSDACCGGVRNLQAMTPGQPERQAACECVKAAAARYPNLKPDAASDLPKKCGVQTNIPISPTTNCKNIS